MKPVHRSPVNKSRSSKACGRTSRTVAAANMAGSPMRGGWRM